MKPSRKVTVNDVALKSGVSMSLAAAVLRNAKSNIGCTESTRERVLKAAKELDYSPNKLARAMKTGIIPQVALCLHHEKSDEELNLYIHDLLPGVAFALKPKGFNATFIPYDSIKDFIEQTQTLADSNLIGGIITNFPPEHENELVGHLKKLGLPHVLFGKTNDDSTPCVGIDNTIFHQKLAEYALAHGFKRMTGIQARKKVKDGIFWESLPLQLPPALEKCGIENSCLQDRGTLCVAFGEFTRRMLIQEKGINEKNIISIEDKRSLISVRPTVLVRSKLPARAEQAADLLTEWITHGRIPEPRHRQVKVLPEDIEFIV